MVEHSGGQCGTPWRRGHPTTTTDRRPWRPGGIVLADDYLRAAAFIRLAKDTRSLASASTPTRDRRTRSPSNCAPPRRGSSSTTRAHLLPISSSMTTALATTDYSLKELPRRIRTCSRPLSPRPDRQTSRWGAGHPQGYRGRSSGPARGRAPSVGTSPALTSLSRRRPASVRYRMDLVARSGCP